MLSESNLLGLDDAHIDRHSLEFPMLSGVVSPYLSLVEAARVEGFTLRAASAYRSYERQLAIWNMKARGERPVLDAEGNVLDVSKLSSRELVFAILRWSALPGASRHHWGSDFDIYDASALMAGQSLALTAEETEVGGPFYPMYQWLDEYLNAQSEFYRPYAKDLGGVAVEPWHLSYAPVALKCEQLFSLDALICSIKEHDVALKELVLEHIDEIYHRYIINVSRHA